MPVPKICFALAYYVGKELTNALDILDVAVYWIEEEEEKERTLSTAKTLARAAADFLREVSRAGCFDPEVLSVASQALDAIEAAIKAKSPKEVREKMREAELLLDKAFSEERAAGYFER